MTCRLLVEEYSVCQPAGLQGIDFASPTLFFARTDDELSLVCPSASVPAGCLREVPHWRGFRVEGTLDFALTGVLSNLSSRLAEAGIPIFAVSTYDTDYLFVRSAHLEKVRRTLEEAGIAFLSPLTSDPSLSEA